MFLPGVAGPSLWACWCWMLMVVYLDGSGSERGIVWRGPTPTPTGRGVRQRRFRFWCRAGTQPMGAAPRDLASQRPSACAPAGTPVARRVSPLRPRNLDHPDPLSRPPHPKRPAQSRVPVARRRCQRGPQRIRHRDRLARSPGGRGLRRTAHRPRPRRSTTPRDTHQQCRHVVPLLDSENTGTLRTDSLRVSACPWHRLPQVPDMDLPEPGRDGCCRRPGRPGRPWCPRPVGPSLNPPCPKPS